MELTCAWNHPKIRVNWLVTFNNLNLFVGVLGPMAWCTEFSNEQHSFVLDYSKNPFKICLLIQIFFIIASTHIISIDKRQKSFTIGRFNAKYAQFLQKRTNTQNHQFHLALGDETPIKSNAMEFQAFAIPIKMEISTQSPKHLITRWILWLF